MVNWSLLRPDVNTANALGRVYGLTDFINDIARMREQVIIGTGLDRASIKAILSKMHETLKVKEQEYLSEQAKLKPLVDAVLIKQAGKSEKRKDEEGRETLRRQVLHLLRSRLSRDSLASILIGRGLGP